MLYNKKYIIYYYLNKKSINRFKRENNKYYYLLIRFFRCAMSDVMLVNKNIKNCPKSFKSPKNRIKPFSTLHKQWCFHYTVKSHFHNLENEQCDIRAVWRTVQCQFWACGNRASETLKCPHRGHEVLSEARPCITCRCAGARWMCNDRCAGSVSTI